VGAGVNAVENHSELGKKVAQVTVHGLKRGLVEQSAGDTALVGDNDEREPSSL
jgi:hypothetical protein